MPFLISFLIQSYRLFTDSYHSNYENMRNEFKIRLVLRQIPCFFIFKYALFIFYYLVINQYTL